MLFDRLALKDEFSRKIIQVNSEKPNDIIVASTLVLNDNNISYKFPNAIFDEKTRVLSQTMQECL